MRLLSFSRYDTTKLDKLIKSHLGKIEINDGYVFLDDSQKILGIAFLYQNKNILLLIGFMLPKVLELFL